MSTFTQLAMEVVKGKRKLVLATTNALLEAGETPMDIINKGLVAGMAEVGVLFQQNKIFVPEVLMSAKAMAEVHGKTYEEIISFYYTGAYVA